MRALPGPVTIPVLPVAPTPVRPVGATVRSAAATMQGQPVVATLQKDPRVLGYAQEPQGEAICFRNDNTGFFTLSERAILPSVALNFYKRL